MSDSGASSTEHGPVAAPPPEGGDPPPPTGSDRLLDAGPDGLPGSGSDGLPGTGSDGHPDAGRASLPDTTPETGTSRQTVARTMIASLLRAALPPLVAVVTLPIVLGHVSLSDYGLWATITGLIAVLATLDQGLATAVTRRIAAARGVDDAAGVVTAGRDGVSLAMWSALAIMPLAAIAGVPIMSWVAPAGDQSLGLALWLGVIIYQTIGWYYALQAAVSTGLQRGDLTSTVNAIGALVGAVVTVAAVLLGAGVFGLLIGMWALGVSTAVGHMLVARRLTGTTRIWLPRRGGFSRPLVMSGLALASLQASLMIEPAAAKALLSAFDSAESAAAMQLGFTVTRLALIAAMAPTAAILVGVSEWQERQPERIPGLVRNASYASLALVGVLAAVMLAAGPYVADAWLGIAVPGIGVAIRGLSVVGIATIVVWLFTQTLLGHGNTRAVSVRLLTGSAVALVGMAATAATFGLAGVIASSLVGAMVAAVLLALIDRDYAGIIWRATARMGPAMVIVGVVGALAADAVAPQGRVSAVVVTAVATVAAAAVAWALLPGATRALMVRTVRERVGR